VRRIPVNGILLEALRGLKGKASSEFVFVCDKTGGPIHKFQHAWLNALGRSGIPRCRFHDLRHTFASHLVAGGVDLVTVKELLGHSDITMTSRYAHSAPENKRQAVAVLERRLGAQDAGSGHFLDTQEKQQILKVSVTS
jgi:integrase